MSGSARPLAALATETVFWNLSGAGTLRPASLCQDQLLRRTGRAPETAP